MSDFLNTSLTFNSIRADRTIAERNRARFDRWGVTCISLIGRPGAGKTVLLEQTITALNDKLEIAAISGDISANFETEAWQDLEIPTIAIHPHHSGHLNAGTVSEGLSQIESEYRPSELDLILIENVEDRTLSEGLTIGEDTIGEHTKVVLLNSTDLAEQILESRAICRDADCILITKTDLAVNLDLDRILLDMHHINPNATILPVSAKTGAGLAAWFNWVGLQVALRSQSAKAAKVEHSRSPMSVRSSTVVVG
ncbi:MAG: hydrogenase nickel incorporation protein HypB [Geitlerinemataceae cyanobacterium]